MKNAYAEDVQPKFSCLLLADQHFNFWAKIQTHCSCRLEIGSHPQAGVQQPLMHVATVTASQTCDLLTLSSLDLARFGPELVAEVQQYAQRRLDWRHYRTNVCKKAAQVYMLASLSCFSSLCFTWCMCVCVTCTQWAVV